MGTLFSCFSNVFVMAEKMTLWLTCTVLICCLVTTITVVLGLGIGLGYNYCYVDMLTRYRYVPAHYIYPGSPRWPYPIHSNEQPKINRAGLVTIPPTVPLTPTIPTTTTEEPVTDEPTTTDENGTETTTDVEQTGVTTVPGQGDASDDGSADSVSPGGGSTDSGSPSVELADGGSSYAPERLRSLIRIDPDPDEADLELMRKIDAPFDPLIFGPAPSKVNFKQARLGEQVQPYTEVIDIKDKLDYYHNLLKAFKPSVEDSTSTASTASRVKPIVKNVGKDITIPINGTDLISLLSKLRANGKNYTLQLITN